MFVIDVQTLLVPPVTCRCSVWWRENKRYTSSGQLDNRLGGKVGDYLLIYSLKVQSHEETRKITLALRSIRSVFVFINHLKYGKENVLHILTNTSITSFAQWRYHSQWGSSEAWLLLVENYTQYPAQWPEILAADAIYERSYGSNSLSMKIRKKTKQ